jgi:hypothetical protein
MCDISYEQYDCGDVEILSFEACGYRRGRRPTEVLWNSVLNEYSHNLGISYNSSSCETMKSIWANRKSQATNQHASRNDHRT